MSFHPQTPQSPSLCSPRTSSEALAGVAASNTTMSASALPTPAHSVNGTSQNDVTMSDESPQKRKRAADDSGDRDLKKMNLEGHKLDISELHRDVGSKYLLCQSPHVASLPQPSADLFEMFGLAGLAAEVAREKPNGEKNALRKTYKGHIKRLGVAGHFDVQKKQEDAQSELLAMINVPELEWGVHQVHGRDIGDGLSETTLSSLTRAMTMSKGPIPKSVWDVSVLGELGSANGDNAKAGGGKLTTPNTPLATTPGATGRSNLKAPPGQDPARPKRNIKKRGYGDDSFEGYSESFAEDGGYDTGDGEGGQKRRKKNPDGTSPYPEPMRQQSYGPGMVGA